MVLWRASAGAPLLIPGSAVGAGVGLDNAVIVVGRKAQVRIVDANEHGVPGAGIVLVDPLFRSVIDARRTHDRITAAGPLIVLE